MCKQLVSQYANCGHRESYAHARCDPVYKGRDQCRGRKKQEVTKDNGYCSKCMEKKHTRSDARIRDGRARLATYGNRWVEELDAIMEQYSAAP